MRNSNLIYRYITLLLLTSVCANEARANDNEAGIPRLVVNITIDQLRSDYLEAFSNLYVEGGLKRFLKEGRVYVNGVNNFSPADRASATATISAGTTPYYNGIIGCSWLDRATLRPVFCTEDKKVTASVGKAKQSARRLLTSTIGDELKLYTQGAAKVFAIAPNDDAAILLAGHAADGAIWIDDNTGAWMTTSYYSTSNALWLSTFSKTNSLSTTVQSAKWTPLVDFSTNASYFANQGSQTTFTHKFAGQRRFFEYKHSALVNSDITNIALQCQQANGLGSDFVTDLLSVQYYAGLFKEGNLSECYLELQDTYLRLDKELKKLIESIERKIGKGQALFVLSSTGYDSGDNSGYEKYNIPSGNFYINRTASLLNMFLSSVFGAGQYVDACYHNHIYLNHKFIEHQHVGMSAVLSRASEFLHMSEGVRDVHTSDAILASANGYPYQLRNCFNPTLSGDIIIEVAPGWQIHNEDTGETFVSIATPVTYPIIFLGNGINPETIKDVVSSDRIAPTIAKCIHIRAPNGCRTYSLF